MSLSQLKRIVLEKQKVPYYVRQHGEHRIAIVLDKEGLHTYFVFPDKQLEKGLIPFDEITEEDVMLLIEKLGSKSIEELLK